MRSANITNYFRNVNNTGNDNNNNANNSNGVALGFNAYVKYDKENSASEGVDDLPEMVNKHVDNSGRTLLAWLGTEYHTNFMATIYAVRTIFPRIILYRM